MASVNIIDELKLMYKVKRFMIENDQSLLFGITDIENAVRETYEEVHISLKREVGTDYDETHKDYSTNVAMMSEWIIEAKLEIKRKKEEKFS